MATRYTHTNLIAQDWRRLATFYQKVFGCSPVPPERDLRGDWLDQATGIPKSHIRGQHLRLPGWGDAGPTLEIFQYDSMPAHPVSQPNTPGLAHLAFAVDDVEAAVRSVMAHGGTIVGALTVRDIPDVGRLTFQYVADPEGNIVELQRFNKRDVSQRMRELRDQTEPLGHLDHAGSS